MDSIILLLQIFLLLKTNLFIIIYNFAKLFINTLLFQLSSILIFSYLYWNYVDDFVLADTSDKNKQKYGNLLDCFFTSITVQAGVGYNVLNPITNRAKFILICQQMIMIMSNVLIFYLFSIHLLNTHHVHRHKK